MRYPQRIPQHKFFAQNQIRSRDDPTCGSAGCNEYRYEWDTHAWDGLHSNNFEEEMNSLPYMKYGVAVVKNKAEEKPKKNKKAETPKTETEEENLTNNKSTLVHRAARPIA